MDNVRTLEDVKVEENKEYDTERQNHQEYLSNDAAHQYQAPHQSQSQAPAPASHQNKSGLRGQISQLFSRVFPHFHILSVTFILAVILFVVYLITEFSFMRAERERPQLTWPCHLYKSGGKYTFAITRKGHLHRLIMPMILHVNFFHLFTNTLSLLMIGFTIETQIKNKFKFALFLVLGALGGTILSATLDPYTISVGFSTSGFALAAAFAFYLYLNFNRLGPNKWFFIGLLAVILAFAFLNGFLFRSIGLLDVDNWGHVGGFVLGLVLSPLFLEGDGDQQIAKIRRLKIPALIALAAYLVIFGVCMFARPLPGCANYECEDVCSF